MTSQLLMRNFICYKAKLDHDQDWTDRTTVLTRGKKAISVGSRSR